MTMLRNPGSSRQSGAYIGYKQLAELLRLLRDSDHTPQSLAAVTGVTQVRMRCILKQFLTLELVDRVGWEKPAHGFAAPVYRMGTGLAVPALLTPDGRPQGYADFKPKLQPRIVAFASIVQTLRASPVSAMELEASAHVARSRLRELMAVMHAKRLVHISGWAKDQRTHPLYRIWSWGRAADVRRPKPKGRTQSRPETIFQATPWQTAIVQLKRQVGIARPACRALPVDRVVEPQRAAA